MQIGDFLTQEQERKLIEDTKKKGVPIDYVDRKYVVPKECNGWKFTNDAKIVVITKVKYTEVNGKWQPMISNYGNGYIMKSVAYIPIICQGEKYILATTSKMIVVPIMNVLKGKRITTGEGEKSVSTWTADELIEGNLTLGKSPQQYGDSTYEVPTIIGTN